MGVARIDTRIIKPFIQNQAYSRLRTCAASAKNLICTNLPIS